MLYIEILRKYDPKVTLGIFRIINDDFVKDFASIELPDKNNTNEISCIPEGEYECEILKNSNRIRYPHISILNVRNRFGIKIHIANFVSQLRGCIACGFKHADLNKDGIIDVTNSRNALNEILSILKNFGFVPGDGKKFKLIIKKSS